MPTPATHVVTSNQLMDGLIAFENIWRRGYRRIGMVMWEAQGTMAVRFSAGYLYAQLRVQPSLRLPPRLARGSS